MTVNRERHKSSSSSSSTNTTASSAETIDSRPCHGNNESDFRYFDLSALPLVGILARRDKTMVLLVRRDGCESVVKLHQGKALQTSPGTQCVSMSGGARSPRGTAGPLTAGSILQKSDPKAMTSISSWKKLPRLDPFSNEVALLMELQKAVPSLVRMHGWGEAQTYKGIVLEALKGQLLSQQLYKPTFSPPSPHQLMFRLMWALQITNAIAAIHGSGIFHGDICANNFAFRVNPSAVDFGQLAVFDLDKASRMSCHSPAYQRARKTFYDHYREFAETRASQYLPTDSSRTYCDLFTYIQHYAEGQLPSKTQPELNNTPNMRRVAPTSVVCEGVLCEHKPTCTVGSQSHGVSRFADLPLPAGPPCGKEHTTAQATQICCQELLSKIGSSSMGRLAGGSLGTSTRGSTLLPCTSPAFGKFMRSHNVSTPSTSGSVATRGGSSTSSLDSPLGSAKSPCLCPACECKEGRAEIANVAFLLAECFSMFGSQTAELRQCKSCWKRLPLTDQRLNEWADGISAYIDGLILHTSRYEQCIAITDVVSIKAKCLDNVQPITALIRHRHRWASLRQELIAQIYSIIHRSLSEDIMSRPTASDLHETMVRIVRPFYKFMRKITPNIPDCGQFIRKHSSSKDPDARKRPISSWLQPSKCKTPSSSVDAA